MSDYRTPTLPQQEVIQQCLVEGGASYWSIARGARYRTVQRCIDYGWLDKVERQKPYALKLYATQKGLDAAQIVCPDRVKEGDAIRLVDGRMGIVASIPYDGIHIYAEVQGEPNKRVCVQRCQAERLAKFDVGQDVRLLPRGTFGIVQEVDGFNLLVRWADGSVAWHPHTDVKAVEWYNVTVEARITVQVLAGDEADARLAFELDPYAGIKSAHRIGKVVFVETRRVRE